MATNITKSTLMSTIWQNFYDRMEAEVTTVSITGVGTVTIQNYVSSFPEKKIDTKSDYPFLVVEPPTLSTESLTFGKETVKGNITIEIYTTQAESADKFLTQILDKIETYKGDLAGVGIQNLHVDSTDSDSAQRQQIKLHVRRVTFRFTWRYSKTRSY